MMQPNKDSFIVVMHSAKSMQFFPNNKSSNFSNILPSNLRLDGYDVALIQLHFYDNLQKTKPYVPIVKTNQDFFTEAGQNQVLLHSLKGNRVNFTKSYNLYGEFVTGLNSTFQAAEINAKVTVTYSKGVPKAAVLNYTNSNKYSLYIDSKLAKILGFSATEFTPGEYKSDLSINQSDFTLFPVTEEFHVSLQRWEVDTLELEQIQDPTLSDLGWSLIAAAAEKGHQISFKVKNSEGKLIINLFGPNKYLVFSPYLMKKMGIPDSIKVSGRTEIDVLPNIIDPYKPFSETYLRGVDKLGFFSSDKVLVLCSLLDSNFFEKESLPLLAVTTRKEGKEEITYIPQNPIYLPVGISDTASINIRLVSDTLKEIPEQNLPTVAVLHFKKSWIA